MKISVPNMSAVVPFVSDASLHTMEKYLYRYVAIKIHPTIEAFAGSSIIIRGKYEREKSIISYKEKCNKLFNWKRPTVECLNDTLLVNCFPGIDYVYHYGALVKSYFALRNMNIPEILIDVPRKRDINNQLDKSNLKKLPTTDIIIVGKVEQVSLFDEPPSWEGEGDFLWSRHQFQGRTITLLGCKFSLWGDIAGSMVSFLKGRGVKAVIYTGKVGGLREDMDPNCLLATGCSSNLQGKTVKWKNIIKIPTAVENVIVGTHVNLFSTIGETKTWYKSKGKNFYFVDPEIGYMAHAALKNKMSFGYIHLISDNVAKMRAENLSNERDEAVIKKRILTNQLISAILEHSLKNVILK